MTKNQTNHSN